MNKKILIFAASIILLAAGCGKKPAVQPTSQTPAQSNATGSGQSSLKGLMMGGVSQKCDVSSSTANSQSQGTVYVSGGKMHGDFTSTVDGKTMVSHMINDGTTIYTWVDGQAMAIKMSATAAQNTQASGSSAQGKQAVDANAQYRYNCSAWNANNSLFIPPSNINFTDESSLMVPPAGAGASAGASTGSANSNAAACSACNNAGAGKAQCLAALHCQ